MDEAPPAKFLQTDSIPVPEFDATDFHAFMKARQTQSLALIIGVARNAAPTAADSAKTASEYIPTAVAHDSGLDIIEND